MKKLESWLLTGALDGGFERSSVLETAIGVGRGACDLDTDMMWV